MFWYVNPLLENPKPQPLMELKELTVVLILKETAKFSGMFLWA